MFANSEDAMQGNGTRIDYATAKAEMERHGMECQPFVLSDGTQSVMAFMARDIPSSEWEVVALNTRKILEWLGY